MTKYPHFKCGQDLIKIEPRQNYMQSTEMHLKYRDKLKDEKSSNGKTLLKDIGNVSINIRESILQRNK